MDGKLDLIRKVLANLPAHMHNWDPSMPVDWGSNDNRNRAFILASEAGAYSVDCPSCHGDVLVWLKLQLRKAQ